MERYSANLSTIFTEIPFLSRFQKANEAGFHFVECQFPYDFTPQELLKALTDYDLSLELINFPAGDWEKGERGLAIDPNRVNEFKASVEKGITYATVLQVKKMHCMAGIIPVNGDRKKVRETFIDNIRYAAKRVEEHGITLLIEPINSFDMPGYFLANLHEAVQILDEIGLPNVKLQYDFYHIQRIHGNLIRNFQQYFNRIGHIQIADVPERSQPGTGEINYENIFKAIEKENYFGSIGLEYTPKGKSEDSFNWISKGQKEGF